MKQNVKQNAQGQYTSAKQSIQNFDSKLPPMSTASPRKIQELRQESAAWMAGNARGILEDVLAELVRVRPTHGRVRELVLRKVMSSGESHMGTMPDSDNAKSSSTIASSSSSAPGSGLVSSDGLVLFAVNEALFLGFVEQTSPACAAACMASCINVVRGLEGDARWTQSKVLDILAEQMLERVNRVQGRIERFLGPGCNLEDLRQTMENNVIDTLSDLREHVLCLENPSQTEIKLQELLSQHIIDPSTGRTEGSQDFDDEEDEDATGNEAVEGEGSTDDISQLGGDGDFIMSWNYEKDLKNWIRKCRGLRRLSDSIKPSTGCIGNWGFKGTTAIISAEHSAEFKEGLECFQLLGKSLMCKMRISVKDKADQIDLQWSTLVTHFTRQVANHNGTALVIHLKNHYAPIYALRVKADGTQEILTSRKGQSPKHWITFKELRSTMLRWNGYCIMVIRVKI